MNRILFLLFLVFLFHTSVAQNRFNISGTLSKAFANAAITVGSYDTAFSTIHTRADNGRYIIKGEISSGYHTAYMHLSQGEESKYIEPFFIGTGNMEIDFTEIDGKLEVRYTGVPFIKEQFTYDSLIKPLENSRVRLRSMMSAVREGHLSHLSEDSLSNAYTKLREEYKRRILGFINEHPDSFFSLYLFNKHLDGLDFKENDTNTLLSAFYTLSDSLQNTETGKSIHLQLLKRKSLLIGNIMPDFHFTDLSSQSFALSSWRNKKYVLLCFWASWCGPCIRSIPLIRRIAERYHERDLQIIYISIDKEQDKWLQAVNQWNPPGLQVCDLSPYLSESQKLRDLYNIRYIPQYFLIDKEGKLIYHSGQMNDDKTEEYNVLQEVLSKTFNGQ